MDVNEYKPGLFLGLDRNGYRKKQRGRLRKEIRKEGNTEYYAT